jgi:serine protease Do
VNSNLVTSGEDIGKAVEEASKAGRKAVLLQVSRDNNNHFVPLPIG